MCYTTGGSLTDMQGEILPPDQQWEQWNEVQIKLFLCNIIMSRAMKRKDLVCKLEHTLLDYQTNDILKE